MTSYPIVIEEIILNELRRMHRQDATPDQMITYLAAQQLQKPLAVLALRRARVMPSSETKRAVHLHPAYAYRRDSDEAFHDSVLKAVEEIERIEAA